MLKEVQRFSIRRVAAAAAVAAAAVASGSLLPIVDAGWMNATNKRAYQNEMLVWGSPYWLLSIDIRSEPCGQWNQTRGVSRDLQSPAYLCSAEGASPRSTPKCSQQSVPMLITAKTRLLYVIRPHSVISSCFGRI